MDLCRSTFFSRHNLGVVGATTAAADLPALEVQQLQQQQCGAHDAGSSDGAPIMPAGCCAAAAAAWLFRPGAGAVRCSR